MIDRLTAAAGRLADVLTRENAALAAFDLTGAAGMLPEKRDAARTFDELRSAIGSATTQHRARLDGPIRHLSDLAADNQRLLERALAVQTRVLGIIARVVRQDARASRYGATGELAVGRRPAALTLSARV